MTDGDLREVVLELLGQLAPSREVRQYLAQFSNLEQSRFAVVKVGGGVLARDLEPLAAALAFLYRLGLIPIVLHGAGPQLDEALAEAGVETRKIDGLRVTSAAAMAVIRPVIYRQNRRLVDALEARGVRARGIQHGVFMADVQDRERLGLVGQVTEVDLESLRDTVRAGAIPVVACLGESASGQVLNVNADVAAVELVGAVKPHKTIFLTPTGGLLDEEGRVISAISLETDYDDLMAEEWVHSGMRLKLQQIRALLLPLPRTASVSITSPEHLTRELFTHGGAGTLVRRGERIELMGEWNDALRERVADTVNAAFGRRIGSAWPAAAPPSLTLLAQSGRAAAVVLPGADGVPYLDKFAVTPAARGEGLGSALWHELRQQCPRLYWRSRALNEFNGWYFQQADATRRAGGWVVFCAGIDDPDLQGELARDALARDSGWGDGS